MSTSHRSRAVAYFDERWDPQDKEYIWICWTDILEGATISVSNWTLPANWTSHNELSSQSVDDESGTTLADCNGVLTSTTETSGKHTFANKVTLSDGRIYERSVSVTVKTL